MILTGVEIRWLVCAFEVLGGICLSKLASHELSDSPFSLLKSQGAHKKLSDKEILIPNMMF